MSQNVWATIGIMPFGPVTNFLLAQKKFSATVMATSFSGGRSRRIRRDQPTKGKQLVNFITCGCESSAPFL